MRTTIVRCCRCGHLIEANASVLELTCGPVRRCRGTTSVDLCPSCLDGFLAWLRPELGTLEPTEPTPPVTVPA